MTISEIVRGLEGGRAPSKKEALAYLKLVSKHFPYFDFDYLNWDKVKGGHLEILKQAKIEANAE